MKSLGINWFIEGYIDFEHKKYILLDYLQEINRHFNRTSLYPNFSDLLFHYHNLKVFSQNKSALQQAFPHGLTQVDIEAVKLTYQKIAQDDHSMLEIERIIGYSISKMEASVLMGKELCEFVESHITIEPVGVVPLTADYGYFSLQNGKAKTNWVYEYQVTIFEHKDDPFRGMNIRLVDTFEQSIITTPEAIKQQLISQRKHLPNPAVYYVHSDLTFPLEETLLPVARKSLVKFINAA